MGQLRNRFPQADIFTIKAFVTLASGADTSVGIAAGLATGRPDVNIVYGEAGTHAAFLPPTNVRPPASNNN